jgi:hypothetical protein
VSRRRVARVGETINVEKVYGKGPPRPDRLWNPEPPIQWVSGVLSLEVKWPRREADHIPRSSVEVKNAWRYNSTPPVRLHGVVLSLKNHGGGATFYGEGPV